MATCKDLPLGSEVEIQASDVVLWGATAVIRRGDSVARAALVQNAGAPAAVKLQRDLVLKWAKTDGLVPPAAGAGTPDLGTSRPTSPLGG